MSPLPTALRDALGDLPEGVFVDVLESDDAYLLLVDLPGATADTVDARVTSGRLWIEARREKSVPEEFRYHSEERPLFLDVELPLPPDVGAAEASASMDRGVLEVRLPKGRDRGRSIPVE